MLSPHDYQSWEPPVAVGAIGGSGTRLLAGMLESLGVRMGEDVDPKTRDSLPVRKLLKRRFRALAEASRAHALPPDEILAEMIDALARHRGVLPADAPWGWKNPRNAWLIPALAGLFPRLKFVYLVRDGRDVALSDNQFLLRTAGETLLDGEAPADDAPAAQLALWVKGTRWAQACAQRYLPGAFLLVRFEDLCVRPRAQVEQLARFVGRGGLREMERAAALVKAAPGIGRGAKETALVARVEGAAELLAELGYT